MDAQTIDYTNTYYQICVTPQIVHIAIDISNKFSYQKRTPLNILSIARAEFPFKGYLLGLVDIFIELKKVHPDLTLTMISYGEDIKKLKNKINSAPNETKKDILLIGKTDYNDLERYYQLATVYIGMGTTVLDAAQRGVPSFAVAAYTEDVCIASRFDQNPYYIAVDENKQSLANAPKIIDDILSAETKAYAEIARHSRDQVVQQYSSDIAVKKIIQIAQIARFNSPDFRETLLNILYQIKSAVANERRKLI